MLARPVKRCESVQAKVSRSTSVVVSGLDWSTLLHSSCWLVTALQTRTQSTLAPSTQPAKRKRPSSPTSASSKRPAVATPSTQLEQLHLSHDNDMGNQEATRLYGQLTSEWANGAGDQAKIRSLLAQLKIELSELGLLFPDAKSHEAGALTTAREVLEIGALFSIRTDDIPAFERYLSLLSAYYSDLSSHLPRSRLEPSILALSLLRLLSQNRIAEFHTLVETLAEDEGRKKDVLESKEVGWVMQLERCLMEGSYSRVWSLCSSSSHHSSLPVAEFAHFTSTLLSTVRSEIAACDERAYESLPLRDAKTLLFFDNEAEVKEFAKQRNWHLEPSTSLLHFPSSPQHPSNRTALGNVPATLATGADSRELDRSKVVEAALRYTKELETIV